LKVQNLCLDDSGHRCDCTSLKITPLAHYTHVSAVNFCRAGRPSAVNWLRLHFFLAEPYGSAPKGEFMYRGGLITLLTALGMAGCAVPVDERVRDYNEDGVYLYTHGDYSPARESFEAALALRPEDAALMYNIGECYDHLGNVVKAEKYYRQCLGCSPNHCACRHALIVLLVRTNRRPEAVSMVQDWLAKEPKSAVAYAEDGWLSRQMGDLPRAQTRLQQALELDPHNETALAELAQVYEDMHRPDRALVLYERILERDPKQSEIISRVNYLLTKGAGRPHPD
jgi:tetratricopeptide (TPR) repeat protein